jgi:DNA-directed RNA polymerase specialized sigma24 family protein
LAALLVPDQATAERIVQDSFAAVHGGWHTLADTDAALSYLRRSVVLASRSAPRLPLAGRAPAPARAGDSQDDGLPPIVSALRALPVLEREVMVLRYFADLPETEIASATGMSMAAVRSHAARAMSSLRAELHPPLND